MIIQKPYTLDYALWPLIDPSERWILNKLELHVRLGMEAYPCGVVAPAGDYCIRPIMNLYGMAGGGFFKVSHPGGRIRNRPGYFATPWVDGQASWTYYLNDNPLRQTLGTTDQNGRMTVEDRQTGLPGVPVELQGISRYLEIERIGNTIIEVSPRHFSGEARQNVIDDYKGQNPAWDELDESGDPLNTNQIRGMLRIDYGQDEWGLVGWRWTTDQTTWVTA